MEFEDSRNALFTEPNAYIQNNISLQTEQIKKPKKIIFQEPYDCLPNYYLNNGFRKNEESKRKQLPIREEKTVEKSTNLPGFDFKNLLPMLGVLGGGSTSGLAGLLSSVMSEGNGLDFTKLVSSLLQNKDDLSSILKLFTGKKNEIKMKQNKDLKSTDFEIKNYTRV